MNDQGNSLIKSICSDSLNLVSDITEASMDSILSDGLLKEIPIIGSVVNLIKVGLTIKDRLFFKKLIIFLREIEKVDHKKRQKF